MTRGFEIRRYDPADADRVWVVHRRAFEASPIEFVEDAPADEDIRAISEHYLDAGGEFLVGEVDGTVVAMGGFQPDGEAVELRRMRVHPDHQRRGYGERLLAALEDRARERGFDRAVLTTHEDLIAARTLYEKHGYEEVHRRTHPAADAEMIRYRKDPIVQ